MADKPRYLLTGNGDDNIREEGELGDLATYFRSLKHAQFYRLLLLDFETQELIRWDILMSPTWYCPFSGVCQLIVDWTQALEVTG